MRVLEGGCFCGAVRYRAAAHTDSVAYCHCKHCRASSGATVMTWVEVARAEFAWGKGEPAVYRHESDWPTAIERRFCARCGTSLTYEREGSDFLDVSVGSLDEPSAVTPRRHVYASRRIDWFEVADELPRHAEARPGAR